VDQDRRPDHRPDLPLLFTHLRTGTLATVDRLSTEAAEIAANNPPTRVLLTCVLGILTAAGWLVGRSWLVVAHFAAFAGLAVKYGYRRGARVQTTSKTQPKTTSQ
jgi:hypothetical protein